MVRISGLSLAAGVRKIRKTVQKITFRLTRPSRRVLISIMSFRKVRWCWRKDLSEFRGLSDQDKAGFLLVLEWLENFRLRNEWEAGREAARAFWRTEVLREGAQREPWQLEQWESAIRWYLNWLDACAEVEADHRSLPERLRVAVNSAGARRGLALRTKQCYGAWAARYGAFAGDEHEVIQVETATRFLTSVVEDEDCAYATQKQALNALAFFFKHVCGIEEPVFDVKLRKTEASAPVVLSKGETHRLFENLEDSRKEGGKPVNRYRMAARLQYGAGLRLSELVRLRVKDVDLERGTVTVRQGKGGKDRVTVLPKNLVEALAGQIEEARAVWEKDREAGLPGVHIPGALSRKFRRAAESFEWFWVFPARQISTDPESGVRRRHHLLGKVYNDAIKRAANRAGIHKRVTSHALRNVFSYCYICLRTLYLKGISVCKSSSRMSWRPSLTAKMAFLTAESESEPRSMIHGVVATICVAGRVPS